MRCHVQVTSQMLFGVFSSFSTIAFWNTKVRDAVNQGHAEKALILFKQIKQKGLQPNGLTFPFVLKACAKLTDLQIAKIIHCHVLKSSFQGNVHVQTTIIDTYVKCHQLHLAHNVFVRMLKRDVPSWNVMLMGFAQLDSLENVLHLLLEMRLAGIQPDAITILALIQAILQTKNVKLLNGIRSFSIKTGIDVDISVANTFVSAYAKCGKLVLAELIFDEIDCDLKSVVSWNSIVAAYADSKMHIAALSSYKKMLLGGFKPDISTIINLLSSCVQPGALFNGLLVHSHGVLLGCDEDICVVNTLISMYSKCGDIDSARLLFDSMTDRTCVSWTTMINGYAEKGAMSRALMLFHAMEATGQKPDLVTIVSLISGCGRTGSLELGKWIDMYSFMNSLKDNVVVCNALIDMYAKCGSINEAREIFYATTYRTVVSWTTMIMACSLNGEFQEALDLFSKMELEMEPNQITFLAVLQACVHGGLLEKGLEHFNLMRKKYNLSPGIDHYSCMVDLLGRKGRLEEAFELIKNMAVQPDVGIWSALLAACKLHRNIDIGKYVSRCLFEMEPKVAVPYVEMANIYASTGVWDGVAAIRTKMRCLQVRKCPGQSILQLNESSHSFTVEDKDHPEVLHIYDTLYSLTLLSKRQHPHCSWEDIDMYCISC